MIQIRDPATVAKCLECYRMKRHEELVTCRKKSCPYNNNDPEHGYWCCSNSLLYDAVALLKEQELVEPIEDEEGNFFCGRGRCSCVGNRKQNKIVRLCNFCPVCGKAVKWNG